MESEDCSRGFHLALLTMIVFSPQAKEQMFLSHLSNMSIPTKQWRTGEIVPD